MAVIVTASGTSPVLVTSFSADATWLSHLSDHRAHTEGATSIPATGGTVTTDCSAGSHFAFTMTEAAELANPTGTTQDGQKIMWQIIQGSGAPHVLSYGTKFAFSADLPEPNLSQAEGVTDYLGAMYDEASDTWRVIAFLKGFS